MDSTQSSSFALYREMMLYVIDGTSERHLYYQLHPEYYSEKEYSVFAGKITESTRFTFLDKDERYAFEYFSRQLEAIERQD